MKPGLFWKKITKTEVPDFIYDKNVMMASTLIKLLIAIIFFGIISCSTSPKASDLKKVEDIYKPVYSAEEITNDLEFALNKRESVLIENIFAEWQRTVKPNSIEFINQNDTIAAIYEVFNSFYKPNDIQKLGDWEIFKDLNSNCKYVVIRNKIQYSILNVNRITHVDWINSKRILFSNFRPPLNSVGSNVLYLTDEYEESISDFLGYETLLAKSEKGKSSEYSDERQRKYALLKDYIPVVLEQKENFWHLATYPYVNRIFLNKSLTKAKIDFSVGSEFGIAILKKEGENWIITENKISLE